MFLCCSFWAVIRKLCAFFQSVFEITGIKDLDESIILFQNGATYKNNKLVTNGGRVLSITSLGSTIEEARVNIYKNVEKINFQGKSYRKDIGVI